MCKIQCEFMLVYAYEINHPILSILCLHYLKLMLLQYFDNMQQNNGFTEHNGAEFFKVICEFNHIYSSKNPNTAYKHAKIRVRNLMHEGYFFSQYLN